MAPESRDLRPWEPMGGRPTMELPERLSDDATVTSRPGGSENES